MSRSYFDVGFDSTRGKIIEIGGYGNSTYNTDIWEWDTTTGVWAQAMPAASSPVPDGRYYHSVAYDPIRRLLLMVGGHVNVTGKNTDVNDSWEWDANLSAWSETTPTTVKPPAREQHQMVFNSGARIDLLLAALSPRTRPTGPPNSGSTCRMPRRVKTARAVRR